MFLTNHARVLFCIADRPDATVREVSELIGITERAVHRIVAELVKVGALRRYRNGRRNRYEIRWEVPLGDPLAPRCSVGELLRAAGRTPCARRPPRREAEPLR
jgi:DNA-binding IclR family transcriptional regulator